MYNVTAWNDPRLWRKDMITGCITGNFASANFWVAPTVNTYSGNWDCEIGPRGVPNPTGDLAFSQHGYYWIESSLDWIGESQQDWVLAYVASENVGVCNVWESINTGSYVCPTGGIVYTGSSYTWVQYLPLYVNTDVFSDSIAAQLIWVYRLGNTSTYTGYNATVGLTN